MESLKNRVAAELVALRLACEEGRDIAPGDLRRLEGRLETLLAGTSQADQLASSWRERLPERARLVVEHGDTGPVVRLDLWQRRAPVVPTTR